MSDVVTPAVAAPASAPAQATTKVATAPGQASAPKDAKPAAPTAPVAEEMWDVPVDGKTVKMTKAEMIKEASLSKGAYKRFEEASQMRREAEGLLSRLRDPKQAVRLLSDPKLGLDQKEILSEFEQWYHESVIKPSEMTPEQRALAERDAIIERYKLQEKEREEQLQKEKNDKLDQAAMHELQQEVISLIDKSGMPKTRFTAKRIAHWIRVNEEKGWGLSADVLLRQVQKETHETVKSLVESSDGDVLVNLLGEETVKKIRRWDLAKIRAKRGLPTQEEAPKQDQDPSKRGNEKITEAQFKKNLRNLWS